MCATEEYAISFFISSCIRAINDVKIIAIILKAKIKGVKISDATGNNPRENLIKPYPAILSKIAANKTEPAVGAST